MLKKNLQNLIFTVYLIISILVIHKLVKDKNDKKIQICNKERPTRI